MGKVIGLSLLVLALLFALGWAVEGNNFFMFKVFAPARANVEREVFENTKSYRQGKVQELVSYQHEYIKADDAHKAALRSVIRQSFADFPKDQLSPAQQSFLEQLDRDDLTTPGTPSKTEAPSKPEASTSSPWK